MVYYDSKLIPAALVLGFWVKKLLNNQNYSIDSNCKPFLTVADNPKQRCVVEV